MRCDRDHISVHEAMGRTHGQGSFPRAHAHVTICFTYLYSGVHATGTTLVVTNPCPCYNIRCWSSMQTCPCHYVHSTVSIPGIHVHDSMSVPARPCYSFRAHVPMPASYSHVTMPNAALCSNEHQQPNSSTALPDLLVTSASVKRRGNWNHLVLCCSPASMLDVNASMLDITPIHMLDINTDMC